jgi:hypothetical protein
MGQNPLNLLRSFKYKHKIRIEINRIGEVMKRGISFIKPRIFKIKESKMSISIRNTGSFFMLQSPPFADLHLFYAVVQSVMT